MRRLATTVVAVVGDGASSCVARLARAANVVRAGAGEGDPLERAVTAWRVAEQTHAPYCAHDADPLAAVADAWVRTFEEEAPRGELEVAVEETLRRWRAGSLELPDYYLVLTPDAMPETRRHWHLGLLHDAAPARVVLTREDDALAALATLRYGPWWPPLDRLLDGIERVAPDRAGLPGRGTRRRGGVAV